MQIPRGVARVNRAVINPIQGLYAWALPPWAMIRHRGRRSGRVYRTPVLAFKHGRVLAVVILYGERSDWVRNLLAGGGEVVRAGRRYELVDPRVVSVDEADGVSRAARAFGRTSGKLLVAELGER